MNIENFILKNCFFIYLIRFLRKQILFGSLFVCVDSVKCEIFVNHNFTMK